MTTTPNEETLTIKTAAEVLGVSTGYVRILIRRRRLATTLQPVEPGARVQRHEISMAELERFMNEPDRRGTRNGRRRYLIRLSSEQAELLYSLLRVTPGLEEVELERAFRREAGDADSDQNQA
jgi:hypothetical protein